MLKPERGASRSLGEVSFFVDFWARAVMYKVAT